MKKKKKMEIEKKKQLISKICLGIKREKKKKEKKTKPIKCFNSCSTRGLKKHRGHTYIHTFLNCGR